MRDVRLKSTLTHQLHNIPPRQRLVIAKPGPMRNQIPRQLRLRVEIEKPEFEELINQSIPEPRRRRHRELRTQQVATPKGLPLEFLVQFGDEIGAVEISSSYSRILFLGGVPASFFSVMMILPTDEALSLTISND